MTVAASANTVNITGHCLSLTVSGTRNRVSVDVADTITASGTNNVITFRIGEPQIDNGGIGNTIRPG